MKKGYLVVKVDKAKVDIGRGMYLNYLDNIPEVERGYKIKGDKCAGSFGAMHYASTYHNDSKKYLDNLMYETARPIVVGVAALRGLKNEQVVPDRPYFRTNAQNPESYHTDNTNGAEATDVFFALKLNLNTDIDQVITLVPGTHKHSASVKGGDFCAVKNKEDKKRFKALEHTVVFGPYEMIIFYENVIHRVSGKKPKKPILRNGLGMRITDSEKGWYEAENSALFAEQGALHHKGGQIAPMYPRLWLTNWPDKMEQFSERLIDAMKTTHTYKTGKRAGQTIVTPHKIPPSLTTLGKRYRDWTEEEMRPFKLRSIYES